MSKELGKEYIAEIRKSQYLWDKLPLFKMNDEYGGPVLCRYPEVGNVSPTTLRYIKVLGDLIKYFSQLDGISICEIGVGYGGQCRVINAYARPFKYTLVDIKPALLLAQRYLDNFIMHSSISYLTMNELEVSSYDLVVSNYAFTELNREIQDVYIEKIIKNARAGYITYNESPSEYNCYSWQELLEMIPAAKRFEEIPRSHPTNCVIIWGNQQ
ncbi:MAG: putative sugar O-methyltransferase [Desulfarculaceae bacterium]|nr:putative sugar O-methyltransferase [Desulfarculaceae bacterium]